MATKHPTSHLTFLGNPHSGRDEMNLAGHPFALLHSPNKTTANTIDYEWPRTLPDGRKVTASWHVGTDATFGLPGPEEELLYLVLLQLTREAAEAAGTPSEWPLTVKFSRGDVLRRLGWGDSIRRYEALELAFNRLTSVSIAAKYAFYDARAKAPVNAVGFGILNEFSMVDEPNGRKSQGNIPLSHFQWNTILHTSFLAGNVRSLALDFVISLELPTSRRLFRLLEDLAQPRKTGRALYAMGLFKLCDRLGMTPYNYPSQIAQKLAPAVEELTARGYLEGMSVEKKHDGEPMALFRFSQIAPSELATRAPEVAVAPSNVPQQAAPETPETPEKLEASEGPLRELPSFAGVLPEFNAPSPADLNDGIYSHIDAFFEALPQNEKDEIDAYVRQSMMLMFLEHPNLPGARIELARGRRRETLRRYPHAQKTV